MNEDSQVNDPDLLGSVAKNRVNRLGGTGIYQLWLY